MIDLEQCVHWMEKFSEQIQQNKEYLTSLDQAIGDGDHGINMSRGMNEAMNRIKMTGYETIGKLFQEIGMTLLAKVGGASGPLYGTAFLKIASTLKENREASTEELASAFVVAVEGMKTRGKAQAGDKTMIDVWEPVAMYVRANFEHIDWHDLRIFTKRQMEKTKGLEAKKGRAAYLGPRSVGHLDPGSVSTYYLFDTLCSVMIEGSDQRWQM